MREIGSYALALTSTTRIDSKSIPTAAWFAAFARTFTAPVIELKDWYHRVRCEFCGREFEDFVLGTTRKA